MPAAEVWSTRMFERAFIFMNHHVHEKKPTEPMVTIQHGKQRIYANQIEILGPSRVFSGENRDITTHVVKAWIECDFKDVRVIE
jgi:hypothetical protein